MNRVGVEFDGNARGAVIAGRQTAQAIQQVRGAERQLSGEHAQLSRASTQAERDLGKLSRGALAGSGIFRGLGRSVAFASAGFLGGYGLTAAVAGAFGELENGIKVAAQTDAVLKSTGGVAGVTAGQIDALAKAGMRKAGVDDEMVKQGENWLLTFREVRNEAGKNNDIFNQATKVTLDLAVAQANAKGTAIDMASSANLVGRALNDPIRGLTALQRVGVTFDQQQRTQIKRFMEAGDIMSAQKVILRELNAEVGGSARAYGQTLPGAIGRARETVRNLAADWLSKLSPAIESGVTRLQDWVDNADNSDRVQRDLTEAVKVGAAVAQDFATVAQDVSGVLGGWKNTTELLIGLKVASVLGGWTKGLKGFIGTADAAEGTAIGAGETAGALGAASVSARLLGSLRALSKIGPIKVAVVLALTFNKLGWGDAIQRAINYPAKLVGLDTGDVYGKQPTPFMSGGGAVGALTAGTPAYQQQQQQILHYAGKYGPGSGLLYRWGGVSPVTGFDCSGYLMSAYAAAGVRIPHNTVAQFNDPNAIVVPPGSERPGDGVYFKTNGPGGPPQHCGIYIGNGQFIEYFSEGKPAKINTISAKGGYMGARRWLKVGASVGGGATLTPHDPKDTRVAGPKTNALPVGIRQALADASLTVGTGDDRAALNQEIAFLRAAVARLRPGEKRVALTETLGQALAELRNLTKPKGGGAGIGTITSLRDQVDAAFKGLPKVLDGVENEAVAKLKQLRSKLKVGMSAADLAQTRSQITKWGQVLKDEVAKQAKIAQNTWEDTTTRVGRAINEAWSLTQRDFNRETDAGLRGIANTASREIAAMQREFSKQLAAFDRETQQGLKALAAPDETPTETLLRSRAESQAAQGLQEALAAAQASGDPKQIAQAQYDIETAAFEAQARLERKAADTAATAAQDAYQQQRDDLRQALQDQETERETARQMQADAEAQAYQDRRDAQWQALNDIHDDQLVQFNRDLTQWGIWISTKQRTYAQFLQWLAANPISKGLGGAGPDAFGLPDLTIVPDNGFGRPHTITGGFAGGGKIPGRYIGRDSVPILAEPGETVIDRSLTQALERLVAGGTSGSGPTVVHLYLDSRHFATAVAPAMDSAQARLVSYRLER